MTTLRMLLLIAVLGTLRLSAQDMDVVKHAELERYKMLAKRASYTLASAEQYDVTHYSLNVVFPMSATQNFYGSSTMTFTSLTDGLSLVEMNAGNFMIIESVFFNGDAVPANSVTKAGQTLSVQLPENLDAGMSAKLRVHYSTPYSGSAVTFSNQTNVDLGEEIVSISSQSEPYDARNWWPCKDDPADKADSVSITLTVDEDMFPVSNGVMLSNDVNADGTRTVRWSSKYPIVTYLVSVAAAKFNQRSYSWDYDGKSMPVESWWYSFPGDWMQQHDDTMLDGLTVLSDLFIPYPFRDEKYGMAEYEWGGAMEHQTVSSMGFYGRDVVIHELAHQWFGDKITCHTFEHIWLNEGWATYCEALYLEHYGGLNALKAKMATEAYYGGGTIFVHDPENNPGNIFNGNLSYSKAAWVMHMLRHVVGDDNFFRAIKRYLGDESPEHYTTAVTEQYQAILEDESGMDLDAFFQQWIYGEYFPTYGIDWTTTRNGGSYDVALTIEQKDLDVAKQVFQMPIDILVSFGDHDTMFVVQNNQEIQTYNFTFTQEPESFRLDPDNWILKKVIDPIKDPSFDQGILLVNGVDWDESAYTTDLKAAFAEDAFTGSHEYTFWDLFPDPAAGYPDNVPAPIGTGPVPGVTLGKYCTVIWLGNVWNGDEQAWANTSIWQYLQAGGNVVLVTRQGNRFITADMRNFLGISWNGNNAEFTNCQAQLPNLMSMTYTGRQNAVVPFATTLSRAENQLLFTETESWTEPRGIGVWGKPEQVGEHESGHMMFIGLRPYRIGTELLKNNMQWLIEQLPCQPAVSVEDSPSVLPSDLALAQNYPNPVTAGSDAQTTVRLTIPAGMTANGTLRVYDVLGRTVRDISVGTVAPGTHVRSLDLGGLPAGMYNLTLQAGTERVSRQLLLVK